MKEIQQNSKLFHRFWDKVKITGPENCWNWLASTQSKGYGSFAIKPRKTVLAHRFAYELAKGKIPKGQCIMHTCDNRLCCNPDHLKTGSMAANNRDMREKHRHAFGERHGNSKLSANQVINMRSDYRDGKYTHEDYADIFEVNKLTAKDAIEGNTWKHLPLAE